MRRKKALILTIRYKVFHSRTGTTIYPHQSSTRTVLIYDRIKKMRMDRDPAAKYFGEHDLLTRIEVQLRGSGITFRRFLDIKNFAKADLVRDLDFHQLRLMRGGNVGPVDRLAMVRIK